MNNEEIEKSLNFFKSIGVKHRDCLNSKIHEFINESSSIDILFNYYYLSSDLYFFLSTYSTNIDYGFIIQYASNYCTSI